MRKYGMFAATVVVVIATYYIIDWWAIFEREADMPDAKTVLQISETNLRKNLFKNKHYDKENYWLSVGKGAYNRQYYSRDTFVTFMGARKVDSLREPLSYAIDWFAAHQDSDGYIPIWFQESEPKPGKFDLNVYRLAPYNLTEVTGGIRNVDHVMQFMVAIYDDYKKSGDISRLKSRLPYADKAWNYLSALTHDQLITTKYSPNGGPDWADKIRRSGKASFINAYWYWVTVQMSELSEAVGEFDRAEGLRRHAARIFTEYNRLFWTESKPSGCGSEIFGHYASWADESGRLHDYFEVDGNSLAVAVGLANEAQAKSILDHINSNFNYYVNKYGASRVLCGHYDAEDTEVKAGEYQNGAYWYIPSYFLAMAYKRHNDSAKIQKLKLRAYNATLKFKDSGLTEWYREGSDHGGQINYSWSIAFPIFLSDFTSVRLKSE